MLTTTRQQMIKDYDGWSRYPRGQEIVDEMLAGVPDQGGRYAWAEIIRHCGIPRWRDHLYQFLAWQDTSVSLAWIRATATWAEPFAAWAVEATGRADVRALLSLAKKGSSKELSQAIIEIRGGGIPHWGLLDTALLAVSAVAGAHAPDPPWLWSDKCPDEAQIANQMALCAGCSIHGQRHGWAGPEFDRWALLLPLVS